MNTRIKLLCRTVTLTAAIGFTALVAGCVGRDTTAPTASSPAPAGTPVASSGSGHTGGHAATAPSGPDGHTGHAMGTRGLDALKGLKGKDFDVAFLSQMIAHHEAAVRMAKDALNGAAKPETELEAQKVVDAQTKEIAQMTKWLKEWYGAAPDAAQQALVKDDMKAMMAMPASTDRMFFEMMIPHHEGAIAMSRLVPERSERAEVKQLAQQIIAAQEREIKDYQAHLGKL